METSVAGGYVLVTVGQLANVCAARKDGEISFFALRVWLATLEQRHRRTNTKRPARYKTAELQALMGSATAGGIERAIAELSITGLLSWSDTSIEHTTELRPGAASLASQLGTNFMRLVPIPRRILRALFRHKSPSEVMAAIGHLIRCLFKRGRKIANYGLVKASWIASVFGIAERSVHSARKWLAREGFLTQERVHQLVMNRWGGKFLINLAPKVAGRRAGANGFAPPLLTKTPYRSTNNQIEVARAEAGVRSEPGPGKSRPPTIKNIFADDLKHLPRLEELYRQAVRANWLRESEANLKNFVCAALRATRAGGRVGAIFVGIVKSGLWHHVTQEQENDALAFLRRHREHADPMRVKPVERDRRGQRPVFAVAALVPTVLNGSLLSGRSAL